MIDADIVETENKIDDAIYILLDLEERAVHTSAAVENSEIQNIAPNRYVKTTDDGTGFECVEGGGDEGGKAGQCSVKKSDENYDTGWGDIWEISKNGMTLQQNVEISKASHTYIFSDETEIDNAAQFPCADLIDQQIIGDVFAENNESFILCDSIEQISEVIPIATRYNFGLVKIGPGINDNNGEISIDKIGFASKENFGLVKIGGGIDDNDGEMSVPEIGIASITTFGVIKLGADFALNENGEMEMAEITSSEPVIYGLAKMKIVSNGIVDLEENVAVYRTFLNEDLQFSFSIGFEPEADFSFILEIISDGEHVVSFDASVPTEISPLGVNRGTTRIKFTKMLGANLYGAEVSLLEAPEPVLLTPNYGDSVKSDLILSSNGSTLDPHGMLGIDVGNIPFQNNPREIYFDFAKSAVVDYVYFYNGNGSALSLFELLGSNDKINWTRLLYKTGEIIEKNTPTEKKGAFHYFKLRFSNEGTIRGIQLWGTLIDNNDLELILLTPQMGANSAAGITISNSNLREGNLYNITAPSANSCAEVDKGSFSDAFIQYAFAEPKAANFLDMASHQDNAIRTARRFKLIASNNGEDWDLLLEREYQEDWKQCETRYFEFENTTAYKYYRLVCSYTANSALYWRISRFRLFRRESGTSSFINCLPPLISASQDGYEVSANSEVDSGHVALNAFDGNGDTKWATAAGDHLNSWLMIKLPEAAAFNAAHIRARSDSGYGRGPKAFKIQASNDDDTWTDLTYQTAAWSQGESKYFYWFNETPYLCYRLLIEAPQDNVTQASVAKFELGRRAKTYRRYLNKYDYVVPILASNNDGGYVVTCSSYYNSNHAPYKVFNRQTRVNDKWITQSGQAAGAWIKIELPTAAAANSFSVASPNEAYLGRMPSSFKIQGSNDDSNWEDLLVASGLSWSGNERKYWDIENQTTYKFYRLLFVANSESLAAIGDWGILQKLTITEY
jgi:hypothetical protein